MGFWKKLLFWRRKRNVAVTTRDIVTTTEDLTSETGTEVSSIQRRRAVTQEVVELKRINEEVISIVSTEASSETRDKKHTGNETDKEKEEMKRTIRALKLFLAVKDCVIQKQKTIIEEMEERQRTEEDNTSLTCEASTQTRNDVRLPRNINDVGAAEKEAEEMKIKIAVMERLLEETCCNNRTLTRKILEMEERQRSEIFFV